MKRGYFNWSERSLASLVEFREMGLSWPEIAGRMSSQHNTIVTPEACRQAFIRYSWKREPSGSPSLTLPRLLASPPSYALEYIEAERERALTYEGFTTIHMSAHLHLCQQLI